MINSLSKAQLVELVRRATGTAGDYARKSKQDYIEQVATLPPEKVSEALSSMHLISGALAPIVANSPSAEPEQAVDVKVVASKSLKELFGIRGKHGSAMVDVYNDPAAPALDPMYRFNPEQLFTAVTAINRGRNVWLAGPAGTGKTEFVKNLCAGLGRAFVRVSFDSGAERYEFIGGERVKNGSTYYQRGIVLRGFTRPGAIILLDEVSFARPEYLSALHAPLEPEGVVAVPETGEVIRKAPGVVFFAADNSNGRGDYTGMYVGVREQNVAFVNRFARTIEFKYMDEDAESDVISKRAGVHVELGKLISKLMNVMRQAGDSSQLDHVPTLREAFYLAEALVDGVDPRLAFEQTMVNRASQESREVLQQIWKANMSNAAIASAIDGIPPVVEPVIDPAAVTPPVEAA